MVKRVLSSIKKALKGESTTKKANPAAKKGSPKHKSVKVEQAKKTAKAPEVDIYEPSAAKHRHKKSPASEKGPGPAPKKSESKTTDEKPAATTGDENKKPRRRRRRRKPASERKGQDQEQPSEKAPTKEKPPPPEEKQPPSEPWDPASFKVEPKEGLTRFHDLDLPEGVMHAIADLGFEYCTPIQSQTLPTTLAGTDVSGKAQTGTGKTAAFLITVFTRLLRNPLETKLRPGTPRVLCIAPTRELVIQIEKEARDLSKYTPLKTMAVFGGMDYEKQRKRLEGEVLDLVVATPGRLLDFKRRHDLHLGHVEIMVIDEADRMLDMGFIPDVRQIIHSTPPRHKRQTLLFSATLTPEVTRLASQWTKDSVTVEVAPEQVAVDTVDQQVFITTTNDKFALLYNILKQQKDTQVIVFGNRRDVTQKLTDRLLQYDINCALLSGAVTQTKRLRTLEDFKSGKIKVLVATDVAGRGIHIDDISHVINYSLPTDPEDYVHRIGRTGRAGSKGISVSFACEEDAFYIPDIEKFIGKELTCIHPDETLLDLPPPLKPPPKRNPADSADRGRRPQRGGGRRSGGGGGRGQGGRRPSGRRS